MQNQDIITNKLLLQLDKAKPRSNVKDIAISCFIKFKKREKDFI